MTPDIKALKERLGTLSKNFEGNNWWNLDAGDMQNIAEEYADIAQQALALAEAHEKALRPN